MTSVIPVAQERGDGLGASQAAQALGLCPGSWGSPIDLWCELTGKRKRPEAGQAAEWGIILEPIVRGVYTERHRVEVMVPQQSLYHGAKPWLRATPDGIVLGSPLGPSGSSWHRLVQVKCPGLRAAPSWGSEEHREVPIYYIVQAAVEMAVTGIERVDFAVLLGGQEYFEIAVHRDRDLEADVMDGLSAFWEYVQRDIPPPVDGSAGYGRYLATLLDTTSKRPLDATDELATLIARWREVREVKAQLLVEESLIKNRLLAAAVAAGARQIRSEHGTIPIVSSGHTHRGWEAYARSLAAEHHREADTEIENYTTRSRSAFPRAPAAWGKED